MFLVGTAVGRYEVTAPALAGELPVPVVTSFDSTPAVGSIFSANSSGTFVVHFYRADNAGPVDPFAWTFTVGEA